MGPLAEPAHIRFTGAPLLHPHPDAEDAGDELALAGSRGRLSKVLYAERRQWQLNVHRRA